ncbi:type IVB secretion system protein IcmG/DotF [Legionella sp. CNM-4043-24]|uniref:type IVB secretion system protein IcmG/DotF n=1 Tax=Legionella sp. CNM-4043-24 TaxID=3421646 RepID=UPI00403B1A05
MTDKIENDDEYQFADLDTMGVDMENEESGFGSPEKPGVSLGQEPKKDIIRNALIVVAIVVVLMVLYKFLGSLFHKDVEAVKSRQQTPPVAQTAPIVPDVTPLPQAPSADLSNVTQKLSDLETSQQSLRADLNGMNSQLNSINENISSLNSKLAALNQSLLTLSGRIEQQSGELSSLIARQNKPKPAPVVKRRVYAPRVQYSIQAIIPGRAWLIAQNGSTLTVREGTIIPGLGTVRLIDPNQGRVVMSTGQVIRFSQQDS